jgi:hypothetical protein
MPKMRAFLSENQPWQALLANENVDLRELRDGEPIQLNERLSVRPFLVTHRGEYSETVGFEIASSKNATSGASEETGSKKYGSLFVCFFFVWFGLV